MTKLTLPKDHPYENGRTCTSCGDFKEASHYTLERDSRAFGGVAMRSKCKPCDETRKWKSFIKRTYGITADEYADMLDKQEGKCAICKSGHNNVSHKSKDRMFVDHDHETGEVRGLLCSKCNMGLGQFNDDEFLLRQAINYLTQERN